MSIAGNRDIREHELRVLMDAGKATIEIELVDNQSDANPSRSWIVYVNCNDYRRLLVQHRVSAPRIFLTKQGVVDFADRMGVEAVNVPLR